MVNEDERVGRESVRVSGGREIFRREREKRKGE